MNKQLTPELKSLKQDFDFVHKKIGELQWKIAIMHYGKVAVPLNISEPLYKELEHWIKHMDLLINNIKMEVIEINKTSRFKVRK